METPGDAERHVSPLVSKQGYCPDAEVRRDRPVRIKGLLLQAGAL